DPLACTDHVIRIWRISSKTKRKICLNGRVHFRRTAEENVPATIWELPVPYIASKLCNTQGIELSNHMQVSDVIGLEGRVCFELCYPVPRLALTRDQKGGRTLNC